MKPNPLLSRTDLSSCSDQELGAAYDSLHAEQVQNDEGTRVYPRLRDLIGTPLEREKDRREIQALANGSAGSELQKWYREAAARPASWWLDHHLGARHSFHSCMACGVCTSQCPAARFHPGYNPRQVVDVALSRDDARLEELLSTDMVWLCGQCGQCAARCPRNNSVMGLVSSLRQLAQLKGWHSRSARGRQQYHARHLWGGNLWNRGVSMHFRNVRPETHGDFGPRWERWFAQADEQMRRVGATVDQEGSFGGRRPHPDTLAELRACVVVGGSAALWQHIEDHAARDAKSQGLTRDEYLRRVAREG